MLGEEYPEETRVQLNDNEVAAENEKCPGIFMISRCYSYVYTPEINVLSAENPLDFFDLSHATAPLEWIAEQKKDETIQKVIGWRQMNCVPQQTFLTDEEEKYVKQFPRLIIDKGVLCREFYDDTGRVTAKQAVVPKSLRAELIYRLHNSKMKGHNGLMKTIADFRERFYFPGFTENIINYIKNCLTCAQVKPIPQSHRTPPLGTMQTQTGLPAEAMQIDIVGQLPNSAGYKYILTAIDVFSRYLFAVPMKTQSAEETARALGGIFLAHSYIPETIVTDQGSNFTSKMIKELTDLLEVNLKHATVKHPQTVGTVERSHAALKKVLKIFQNMNATNWHTFVDYACYSHNTSYHSSIRCAPTLLFHGRDPNTPLDLRYGPARERQPVTQFKYTTEVRDNMAQVNAHAKHSAVQAYTRYRKHYDRQANANPLKLHSYCLLMNPKLTRQDMFAGKGINKWLALYRVEKVLTNMNYIVRKVGTWFTQCVHRIRLRPFTPTYAVVDMDAINPDKFLPDPYHLKDFKEPQSFDEEIENLVNDGNRAATEDEMASNPYNYAPILKRNVTRGGQVAGGSGAGPALPAQHFPEPPPAPPPQQRNREQRQVQETVPTRELPQRAQESSGQPPEVTRRAPRKKRTRRGRPRKKANVRQDSPMPSPVRTTQETVEQSRVEPQATVQREEIIVYPAETNWVSPTQITVIPEEYPEQHEENEGNERENLRTEQESEDHHENTEMEPVNQQGPSSSSAPQATQNILQEKELATPRGDQATESARPDQRTNAASPAFQQSGMLAHRSGTPSPANIPERDERINQRQEVTRRSQPYARPLAEPSWYNAPQTWPKRKRINHRGENASMPSSLTKEREDVKLPMRDVQETLRKRYTEFRPGRTPAYVQQPMQKTPMPARKSERVASRTNLATKLRNFGRRVHQKSVTRRTDTSSATTNKQKTES